MKPEGKKSESREIKTISKMSFGWCFRSPCSLPANSGQGRGNWGNEGRYPERGVNPVQKRCRDTADKVGSSDEDLLWLVAEGKISLKFLLRTKTQQRFGKIFRAPTFFLIFCRFGTSERRSVSGYVKWYTLPNLTRTSAEDIWNMVLLLNSIKYQITKLWKLLRNYWYSSGFLTSDFTIII